jgi:hypothetical protein
MCRWPTTLEMQRAGLASTRYKDPGSVPVTAEDLAKQHKLAWDGMLKRACLVLSGLRAGEIPSVATLRELRALGQTRALATSDGDRAWTDGAQALFARLDGLHCFTDGQMVQVTLLLAGAMTRLDRNKLAKENERASLTRAADASRLPIMPATPMAIETPSAWKDRVSASRDRTE